VSAPAGLGLLQLAEHVGLHRGEIQRARDLGLLPPPDTKGRWSPELATTIRVAAIRAALAAEETLGARRCAAHLAERTGLPVDAEDISTLAQRDLLQATGEYKGYPLYPVADVLALAEHPDLPAIVEARRTWLADSLDVDAAADRLAWRYDELLADAAAFDVTPGRLGRLARADVEALAANEEFLGRRLLGPEQAAVHLDIRRVDLEYAVAAGWLAAAKYTLMQVGRRSHVRVPLYRRADVDALREIPGVDWAAVREVRPGQPSVLREYARRPPSRARIIRRLAADLGTRFHREVWAYHRLGAGWALDWEVVDGIPTREQVADAIAEDPVGRAHLGELALATEAGAAVNWARDMLAPDTAVILDTETTDLFGAIVEIAVIDTATGKTLLDTLVNPGCPIEAGAQAIHGISDADVADAPTWDKVLPKLKRITKDRLVLAYNADYDETVVRVDTRAAGLKLGHLADADRWGCVMLRRSDWCRSWRWLPLGGGHRALGDTQAARQVLLQMTAPLGLPKARRQR
jgi:DNA polymerase III epsilon subunit-like protein